MSASMSWARRGCASDVVGHRRVHVEERGREGAGFHLVHLGPPLGAPLVLAGSSFSSSATCARRVSHSDRPSRSTARAPAPRGNPRRCPCRRTRRPSGMRLQVAKAFAAVGIGPAREWIETAGERAIGMDATAALVEEHARRSSRSGARCPRLGVAGEELGRRQPSLRARRSASYGPTRIALP